MDKDTLLDFFEVHQLWGSTQEFKRNSFIKYSDSVDQHIYFIESGSVKIAFCGDKGEEIVRLGYAGDIIVALDSFLSDKSSELFIQAIKETKIKKVTKSAFIAVVYKSFDNLKVYNTILEMLLVDMLEREKDLLIHSPKERLERLLKRNPQVLQHIPKKYIAQYLKMTPETLSRLCKS